MQQRVVAARSGPKEVGLTGSRRGVAVSASRPTVQTVGAVASAPARSIVRQKPQQPLLRQQEYRFGQVPAVQRARRPQQLLREAACDLQGLPRWADRFRRQVGSLPQGQAALYNLLHAVDRLLLKAENCGSHSGTLKSYLNLGLVDLASAAWQQRAAQLELQSGQLPACEYKHQQLEAVLALAGCRYLRIEAREQLAKQLHLLLDDEGYCPSLNLAALPAPHALGLPVPQLLREGLGVDLHNPTIRVQAPATGLSHLTWDEYTEASADQSMCGDWQFCYWVGDATWVPAPFGKFSTSELAAVLTQGVVLSSLPNGIWGRALVTAAQEQGLPVEGALQQPVQQLPGSAALAAAGMQVGAVRQLLQDSMGLQAGSSSFKAHVREFSAAVAAVRSAMLNDTLPTQGASVQGN